MKMMNGRVDSHHSIAVLWACTSNMPSSEPPPIDDPAMLYGFEAYQRMSSETLSACRRNCFCILAHGGPTALEFINEQESMGYVINWYNGYGRSRRLLLLSCLTGLRFARNVSAAIGTDVISPTGLATIDGNGELITVKATKKYPPNIRTSALNWVRVTPRGDVIMQGSAKLGPAFVAAELPPQTGWEKIDVKR